MKKNMNMKYISLIYICVVSFFVIGCSPMDDTYKDFDKDGPITYLTKLSSDSVLVDGGWYRLQVSIPKVKDNRAEKVFIIWNNGKDSLRTPLNANGRTNILLENMREGSFILTCRLEDNDGNRSLNTDVQGMVYGDTYQSYLRNRIIASKSSSEGDLLLKFNNLSDSTAIASVITWQKSSQETTETFYYDETNTIRLEEFGGTSFKMKTLYKPEIRALDYIESNEEEFSSL